MRKYVVALIIVALVLYMHLAGLGGLYLRYGWYDIFMHIFGGIGIGLFVLAIIDKNRPYMANKRRNIIIWVILAGLLWELFEAVYNVSGYPLGTKMYYLDTLKDLV